MTRIHERIATSLPIEATFDYIADFANSEEWIRYHLVPSTG